MRKSIEGLPKGRLRLGVTMLVGGLSLSVLSLTELVRDDPVVVAAPWGANLPVLVIPKSVPVAVPTRLVFPGAGLDVRVQVDKTPPGGVIKPPSYTDVYWIEAYGKPGTNADNTVYIAGHSSPDHSVVFDALLETDGSPRDLAGEELTLNTPSGSLVYRIDGAARRYDKNALANDPEIWKIVPGRLLLVTCDQEIEGRNTVFFATLQGASS